MKKLINNPRFYIFILYVLFVALSIFAKGNLTAPITVTITAIVFFLIGNVGKENRDFIAKSIGGGGIPRPKDPPKDDDEDTSLGN